MSSQFLQHYWGSEILAANVFIGLNLLGAQLLGMLIGYERSYQGRAAGMRTYGLVCMASTGLTIFAGFAPLWYGGSAGAQTMMDPTRITQGIVTGIGFLCAGVIMKDGLSIRGLTTAASIWAVSAVGVLLGTGFYLAALLLSLLCALSMSFLRQVEVRLPGRASLDVTVTFREGYAPGLDEIIQMGLARGHRGYRKFTRPFLRVWRVGSGRASAALGTDRAQIGGSCVGFRHRGATQRLSA